MKRWFRLNKGIFILAVLVINFSLLGYLYLQLQQVKTQLITMQYLSSRLGDTLNSCAVIPEAYHQFRPSGGYENQLAQCSSAYKLLTKIVNKK